MYVHNGQKTSQKSLSANKNKIRLTQHKIRGYKNYLFKLIKTLRIFLLSRGTWVRLPPFAPDENNLETFSNMGSEVFVFSLLIMYS